MRVEVALTSVAEVIIGTLYPDCGSDVGVARITVVLVVVGLES
jgi:hypothetical protein